ncbi:MAG: class I SAM-dependent methyltransferase [Pseudomonadota bacterium]
MSDTDWTAGYVADIGYTYGYYTQLNPLLIKLAFLNAGLTFPNVGTACELGFGQGVSTNIHAAASVTSWYGTDFNPSQASFAQELATTSGADVHLFDQSFAEFCTRPDLPDFDFIGLHGIWSWISDDNRAVIIDFLRRKLKVGGVLYISYNTLPGWSTFAPMRHLLTQHAQIIGAEGHGIVNRINGALDFADKLLEAKPRFGLQNPQIEKRLEQLRSHNRHYLAHEYFNRDWLPMHFATMAEWLEPAKLTYACSANYTDHLDVINFTPEQNSLLNDISDPILKETVRDFIVNQQFRKDYWIKGARKLSNLERTEALQEQRIILITPRDTIALQISLGGGKADLNESIYSPILDILADHTPRSISQLTDAIQGHNIGSSQLLQSLMILIGKGDVTLMQDEEASSKARAHTDKLNRFLINRARSNNEITTLASPLTAGGIPINRFEQLFLLARIKGQHEPEAWAQFAWNTLSSQGQKLIVNEKTLESAEENLTLLKQYAQNFNTKKLPTLIALQIA